MIHKNRFTFLANRPSFHMSASPLVSQHLSICYKTQPHKHGVGINTKLSSTLVTIVTLLYPAGHCSSTIHNPVMGWSSAGLGELISERLFCLKTYMYKQKNWLAGSFIGSNLWIYYKTNKQEIGEKSIINLEGWSENGITIMISFSAWMTRINIPINYYYRLHFNTH